MATCATLPQCNNDSLSTISANLMSTKIPNGNMQHCNNTTIIHCATISANLISSIATKWQHAILQ